MPIFGLLPLVNGFGHWIDYYAEGHRRPVVKEGSNFNFPVETVIVEIGGTPNPLIRQTTPGLEVQKWAALLSMKPR